MVLKHNPYCKTHHKKLKIYCRIKGRGEDRIITMDDIKGTYYY